MIQTLLRFNAEARFMRYAEQYLRLWFPYLPQCPGYNKRLRRLAETIKRILCVLARENPLHDDGIWVVDPTPSANANPEFATVLKVVNALGLHLQAATTHGTASR